jgi:uncharacterized membrane protein
MLKPHYFFLTIGFIFGTLFLSLTPAFQVPDEVNHFYRTYHIAEGHLGATKHDNRLGGFMPKSVIKAIHTHLGIKGSPYTKTSFKNIQEQLDLPIDDFTPEFVDFPNTALYTPISYAPQALTVAFMKALGIVSPFKLLYLGRFSMLLLWLAAVFYTIKNIPIFPWFFTVVALLPMSVFVNMSVSADVMTNILGFLWLGHVLKLAFGENNVKAKDIVLLFILAILLASAKYVYTPSVFLVLLIPFRKYASWNARKCALLHGSIILVAFAVAFMGSSYASSLYISNASYNQAHITGLDIPYGADINGQIAYLKNHPARITEVVFKAFEASFSMLRNTYIGVLGWLDVSIPMLCVYLGYAAILLVLFHENAVNKFKISVKHRVFLLGVGLGLMFLVYLSQYLSWAAVGSEFCGSIQGRYFITILPLIFLGLVFIPLKIRFLLPVSLSLCLIVLCGATQSLYSRYYAYSKKYLEIVCDADATWTDPYMGEIYFQSNTPEIMVFNGVTQSSEQARSGSYSSKVTKEKPYGATFRLYNFTKGDTLRAEVWYFGQGGTLWMTNAAHDRYHAQNVVTETDAKGWNRLNMSLTIDTVLENAEIGMFVESQNLCYFDDIKITVHPKR